MKLTKYTLIAATLATIGSTAAFADNQPHQTLLALDRARTSAWSGAERLTIALYSHQHGAGVGRADRRMERRSFADMDRYSSESRFVLRSNHHGGFYGLWEPAR